jgi:hypothetical protein
MTHLRRLLGGLFVLCLGVRLAAWLLAPLLVPAAVGLGLVCVLAAVISPTRRL